MYTAGMKTNERQEYVMLSALSSGGLSEQVNNHLMQGWQLYASPAIAYDARTYFIQALVRVIELPSR